jgi:hypothetical protein
LTLVGASCDFVTMPKKATPKKRNKTAKYRAALKAKFKKKRKSQSSQKARKYS